MIRTPLLRWICALLCCSPWACTRSETLHAVHQQGALHAFLLLRNAGGQVIGTGDEVNVRAGALWHSHLTLRFNDGSIDDETSVYMQHTTLRLLTDHHVQKGPSFPKAMDMTIDVAKGAVTWHDYHDGADEVKHETMAVPSDLCNGIVPIVMQNLPHGINELKMSYIAATPKPRVVTMAIHLDGESPFRAGGGQRRATQYRVHVELGGITGLIAPVIGKEPPDLYVWVVEGDVPTFLRMQGFLYIGGPIWSLQLLGPSWPSQS